MTVANLLSEIADDYIRHSRSDYVGLWQIASRVREDLELLDNKEVQQQTLCVVRKLIEQGLFPGDYHKIGFRFWDEDDLEVVARIEKEWDPENGDPTLAKPICWFGAR